MAADRFSARKPASQPRAHETVDAILDASARIVDGDGTGALTTKRIAEIAGVSIGSLYQYFPGKEAVLHALVRREFNKTVDANVKFIAAIDAATTPLEKAIAGIVDHVFEGQNRRRPFYRQIVMSVLSIKHMKFTLENDQRVLDAVKAKLSEYPAIDQDGLDGGLFVALHALKGVQIGMVLSDREASAPLRDAVTRSILACVRSRRDTC